MASIGDVFKEETKKAGARPTRATKWIHYSKIEDNQNQYRCGSTDEERQQYRKQVEDLAMLITASGAVLQNLLVKKIGTDEYEMIAGHHRRDACKKLVEEDGLEDYALLPCNIETVSEAREEFDLYATNIFPEKSEYEKMHELERMKYLIETYPEEFPDLQKGRMVDRLAAQMNMSKTTVGEYLTIAKNLEEEGKKQFRSGELKKSAAVELASLEQEEQKELLKKGTTYSSIMEYRRSLRRYLSPFLTCSFTSGIDAARSEIRTSVSGPAFSSARIQVMIFVVLAIGRTSVSFFPYRTRPVSPSSKTAAREFRRRGSVSGCAAADSSAG